MEERAGVGVGVNVNVNVDGGLMGAVGVWRAVSVASQSIAILLDPRSGKWPARGVPVWRQQLAYAVVLCDIPIIQFLFGSDDLGMELNESH